MTDENAKIKYQHLKNIIAGKYSTERFHVNDKMEEKNLDIVSNELLVSDAKRHLAQLVSVRPNIDFEDKHEEDVKRIKKNFDKGQKIRAEKEAESKEKK